MTAPERADWLIKQLGPDKALDHAEWVKDGAHRRITIEYWEQVIALIKDYTKTLE